VSEKHESLNRLSVVSDWAGDPWKFEDYGELYHFGLGLGVEGRRYLLSVVPITVQLTAEVWLFASLSEVLPNEPPHTLAKCLFDPMVKGSHTIANEGLRVAKSEGKTLPAGWQIWVEDD
jgi:hypothetical protein